MIVHPSIKERLSVNLKDVTVREALVTMREMYGYEYKVNVVANKALLVAYAEGEYEARRRHVRLAARDTPAARRPRFWWRRAALPALSAVVLGPWWWLL